jgi:hypothetical protein
MDEMDDVNVGASAPETHDEEAAPLPPFHKRVVDVFFNPGRLARALRDHPVWAVAMVVGAVLVGLQLALIPTDVLVEARRQALLRAGQQMPALTPRMETIIRWSAPIAGMISTPVMEFILAGVVTLLFAFILGDEGRYRQYLAVLSHSWLIPAVVEFVFLPLKIAEKNPQMTVSLGTFCFFLPEGYLLKVMSMMSLSQIWAWLVVAAGVHAINPKRRVATAAAALIILNLVIVMIFAIFTPSMG